MPFFRVGRFGSGRACLLVTLAALTSALASCGTQRDDTIGIGLIGDRDERKAVQFVSVAPDTSAVFQSTSPAADIPTAITLLVSARPGYLSRVLSRFASSSLPPAGTVVDSVHVDWPWREGFGTSPFSLAAHRVTSAWVETSIAADSFPAYDVVPAVSLDIPFTEPLLDTLTMAAPELTAIVQSWVADSTTNFGIALLPATGEDGELELDSRESGTPPRLIVHWTISGRDTSVSLVPNADVWVLGTTPAFIPLSDEPRRLTVSRGFPTRSLMRFAWPDLGPRSTVHRAELTLHLDAARTSARSFTVGIKSITAEPWQGFVTETDPDFHGATVASALVDSLVLDLTELITETAVAENHGFMLRAADERVDTDYFRFHAQDTEVAGKAPSLRIWYTPGDVPEDAP